LDLFQAKKSWVEYAGKIKLIKWMSLQKKWQNQGTNQKKDCEKTDPELLQFPL